MTKRILSFILVLALTLVLIPAAQVPTQVQAADTDTLTRYCIACDLIVDYVPLTSEFSTGSSYPEFETGHFYLPKDLTFGKKTLFGSLIQEHAQVDITCERLQLRIQF